MFAQWSQSVEKKRRRELERKFILTGLSTTFGGVTSFTFLSLTDVPQAAANSTDQTRIGDFIRAQSLDLRITVVRNPVTSNVVEYVRWIILQRHAQFSKDPPTGTNTFLNDPSVGSINFRSHFIIDGKSLFTVLHDETIVMTGLTSTTEGAVERIVSISLASARKKMDYINGSTTDGIDNIFLGYCCNTITTPPTMTMGAKFVFTDP